MSDDNAEYVEIISQWADEAGISTTGGRDLSAFLTGAVLIATADGELGDEDWDTLDALQQVLTGKELTDEAADAEITYISEKGFDDTVTAIGEAIGKPREREFLIKFCAIVALDEEGDLSDETADALANLGDGLGLTAERVDELVDEALGDEDDEDDDE